ncbi:MAG: adenylate/guanylate cyclase domain-containing protein, partial [Candidatus Zipacnadales bacterium]
LRRAYSGYERAYRATGGYWTGINAATMAILLGETATGQHWARQVRTVCLSELQRVWDANQDPYWVFATLGEAALILENYEEAAKWYRQAAQVGRGRYGDLSSTRRNARLLLSRLRGDVSEVERLLPVPRVAVLSGHRLGSWHGDEQGLRNDEQETFKLAIRERLQERNALIAYASVGCEFDILFCEAVLELKGEIHLVLPCDKDEFFREGVALLPGLDWCDRWEQLLAHAAEVLIASPGPLASSPLMYEYVDLMLYGLSNLRAEQLETELVPFILLDTTLCSPARVPTTLPPYWNSSRHPLEVIDLAHFRDRTALELSPRPPAGLDQGVEVRSADFSGRIMVIMFADAANFGKLTDQAVRRFVEHFMGGIARLVQDSSATPVALNTWGDGLFAIFDTVRAAGNFALELIDFVATQDWTAYELPADLNLRVALHAGPIWACTNPVTGKCDYIGTHVTRAARLEPITPPGHIYASHGFAAIAAAEGVQEFVCEYVGETPLAKGAGMCPTYHVRQKHR